MKKAMKTAGDFKHVAFRVTASPKSNVSLAGTFNQWDVERHPMKDILGNGAYTITLMLPKGEHAYKFVINGNWVVDPECRNWVLNSFGTLNSVIKVE